MMQKKIILNLLNIFIVPFVLLLVIPRVSAQTQSKRNYTLHTLSPALVINSPLLKTALKETSSAFKPHSFMQRRPKNWDVIRGLQKSVRPPAAKRSETYIKIDLISEDLLLYPSELIRSPELFNHVNTNDPAVAYDMEHFEYDELIGYWRSKDFPDLILGTWQDIEKISYLRDSRSSLMNKAKMRYHVITRLRDPKTGKPLSFYYYDNHAYAVPYYLDSVARGELPEKGNTQIFIDNHPDDINVFDYFDFPLPDCPADWLKLMKETGYLSFDNFNSILAKTGFLKLQIHVLDSKSSANWKILSEDSIIQGVKKIAGVTPYINSGPQAYFSIKQRPLNTSAPINIDTDVTDPMLGLSRRPSKYKGTEKEALQWYTTFLTKLVFKDKVSAATFHANTSAERNQFGDVEIVKFLARIAPVIFLKANELTKEELNKYLEEAVNTHKDRVAISPDISKDTENIIKKAVLNIYNDYSDRAI